MTMGKQSFYSDASYCWTNGVGNSSGLLGSEAGGDQLKIGAMEMVEHPWRSDLDPFFFVSYLSVGPL